MLPSSELVSLCSLCSPIGIAMLAEAIFCATYKSWWRPFVCVCLRFWRFSGFPVIAGYYGALLVRFSGGGDELRTECFRPQTFAFTVRQFRATRKNPDIRFKSI